jgi:hypothetical protein
MLEGTEWFQSIPHRSPPGMFRAPHGRLPLLAIAIIVAHRDTRHRVSSYHLACNVLSDITEIIEAQKMSERLDVLPKFFLAAYKALPSDTACSYEQVVSERKLDFFVPSIT